jgi:SAM-dependent methyltransferase
MPDTRRQNAPAAERNTRPILSVLHEVLPVEGRALEIASGTGQHAVAFARTFPGLEWHPSDVSQEARASISAWAQEAGCPNLHPPREIDVTQSGWHELPERPFTAVLAINLIHISPWAVTQGLVEGAGRLLKQGGLFYLYGPYRVDGEHTAESNIRFEELLKAQSEEYGVRDMAEVEAEAGKHGFALEQAVAMPANNFSVIFRRR